MTEKPLCPLCGDEMTAIETHPGRGELYCAECDLVIGGNCAKTPDELMDVLGRGECEMKPLERFDGLDPANRCLSCGAEVYDDEPNYCSNCGKAVRR